MPELEPEPEDFKDEEVCTEFVYFNIPVTKKELKLVFDVFLLDVQLFKKTGLVEDILQVQDEEKIMFMVEKDRVEDFKKFIKKNEIEGVKE